MLVLRAYAWARVVRHVILGGIAVVVLAACGFADSGEPSGLRTDAARPRVSSSPAPRSSPAASPVPSPSPSPTPSVTTRTVTETEAIPFRTVEQDDPGLERGATVVAVAGVDGVRTRTFDVTLVDGVETERRLVSEEITTEPVDEVIRTGTYEPPEPEPEPEPEEPEKQVVGGGCDPNYAGACVPIASDVDCAGGSGNGPEYVSGPVYVVGPDIYDLDRDGDGVACER